MLKSLLALPRSEPSRSATKVSELKLALAAALPEALVPMQASKSDLSFALSHLNGKGSELTWSLGPADRDFGLQSFIVGDPEFAVEGAVPVRMLSFTPILDNLYEMMLAKYREFRDA